MNETEMIEEATQRAMMTPILHNLEADVDYYLDEVRQEQQTATVTERWEATLPDKWDTHKLGSMTPSGIGICAEDCEACEFRFALKTMPLTVWVGVDGVGTPVFTAKSKRLAEHLRITEWEGDIITITKIEVTQ
jgi:hypothetical protein